MEKKGDARRVDQQDSDEDLVALAGHALSGRSSLSA
jgi:hypothetical protein